MTLLSYKIEYKTPGAFILELPIVLADHLTACSEMAIYQLRFQNMVRHTQQYSGDTVTAYKVACSHRKFGKRSNHHTSWL